MSSAKIIMSLVGLLWSTKTDAKSSCVRTYCNRAALVVQNVITICHSCIPNHTRLLYLKIFTHAGITALFFILVNTYSAIALCTTNYKSYSSIGSSCNSHVPIFFYSGLAIRP